MRAKVWYKFYKLYLKTNVSLQQQQQQQKAKSAELVVCTKREDTALLANRLLTRQEDRERGTGRVMKSRVGCTQTDVLRTKSIQWPWTPGALFFRLQPGGKFRIGTRS